jgi:hypothetical protein
VVWVREEGPGRWTWPASTALLAGYLALAAATAAAVAVGGTHRPGIALGVTSATAFAVATRATVPVALATGAMGWLFYAGFITGRHAQLAWHGSADIQRLGILLGVAFCGAASTWVHARARTRRPRPAEPAQVWLAPVASLVDARTARRGRPVGTVPAAAEPRQRSGKELLATGPSGRARVVRSCSASRPWALLRPRTWTRTWRPVRSSGSPP